KLTRNEIEQARKAPIEKIPSVELASEQIREASTPVTIKLPPEEDPLDVKRIENATIMIAMDPTLSAKYYVEITNLPSVLNPFNVRATKEAKEAYENQQLPQMTLYIFDTQEVQRKSVHYNFPEKYVREGEIELTDAPAIADFKLIPRPSSESK
ncbi:MAG TPA: hypothetical protein DIU00_24215, partial [Phycisphaerales bacterium]|nr:hypothetical protein [Phycisphaerales bacterium]